MDNDVGAVDQLRQDRRVADGIDGVLEPSICLEMLDVVDAAGREIVDDSDLVAAFQISLGQVRSDKPSSPRDQQTQTLPPTRDE